MLFKIENGFLVSGTVVLRKKERQKPVTASALNGLWIYAGGVRAPCDRGR